MMTIVNATFLIIRTSFLNQIEKLLLFKHLPLLLISNKLKMMYGENLEDLKLEELSQKLEAIEKDNE